MDLLLREYTNISDDVINYVIMPYTDCCECKRPNRCSTMDGILWCRNNGCGKKPLIGKNKRLYHGECMCRMLERNFITIDKFNKKRKNIKRIKQYI